MTNIYHFDHATGEAMATTVARRDPLAGTPMIPANATTTPPPEVGSGKVAVWDGGDWAVRPDHRGVEYWLADGTHHTIIDIGEAPPPEALDEEPPAPRADQRAAALAEVDAIHARYLSAATGNATTEERDTWAIKEAAARAVEDGTATAGQSAMLEAEAVGAGVDVEQLIATIIAKADAFLLFVGRAAGIRAKARAAVRAATDEAVPLDEVSDQVAAAINQLSADAQAEFAPDPQDPTL